MHLEHIEFIEDCLDGSLIRELHFSGVMTRAFIDYLGELGNYEYFTFGRPFFRITKQDVFIIKGVEGNASAKIILSSSANMYVLSEISDYICGFIKE